MDYYNLIIDRKSGAQVTIGLEDIYLVAWPAREGSAAEYVVCNKHTDLTWVVDPESFHELESALHERGRK